MCILVYNTYVTVHYIHCAPVLAAPVRARAAGRLDNRGKCDDHELELRDAVAELPESQRTALRLAKLEDLPLAEAARRSGLSVGALKVATHRALKTLRRRLGGEDLS